MEGAVRDLDPEQLDDAAHASFPDRVLGLEHQPAGAHPHYQAVAATVEGKGGLRDLGFGRRRTRGEEAGAYPLEQVVAGHVIGGDDDHAPAASAANPIAGEADGLGCGGAGRVHLRVRAACTEQLADLGVAHREHVPEELAVEMVGRARDLGFDLGDPAIDSRSLVRGQRRAERGELGEALATGAILVETGDLADERVVAGEGGGEDDAGLVGERFGKGPAIGQPAPLGRLAVAAHQRDSRVAQREEGGRHGELRGHVEGFDALLVDAELLDEIEAARQSGQLDDLGGVGDGVEARAAVAAFHQADDLFARHPFPHPRLDGFDEAVAAQDALEVVVLEDAPRPAGKADGGSGDDDRAPLPLRLGQRLRRRHAWGLAVEMVPIGLQPLLEEAGEELAEREVSGLARRLGGPRRERGSLRIELRAGLGHRGSLHGALPAETGGPQATERLGERFEFALLRLVGGDGDGAAVTEHVVDERREDALGTDLDEDARAEAPGGLEALYELDGRGDLPRQQVEHLRAQLAAGRGIELAGDVADDGNARRLQAQPLEDAPQRLACRRDDLGMEGMADGQEDRAHAELLESGDRLFDRAGRPADDGLLTRVDVGGDDVASDLAEHLPHLFLGREDGGHLPVVRDADARHLLGASGDREQRVGERHRAAGDERGVLSEAVAHHQVGLDAALAQQPHQRDVCGEHRGLADLRVAQRSVRLFTFGEDVIAEAARDLALHRRVRLLEGAAHDRMRVAQPAQHPEVLRALAWEEEGDLGRRAGATEDSAGLEHAPDLRVFGGEGLERLLGFRNQRARVLEVDDKALGRG